MIKLYQRKTVKNLYESLSDVRLHRPTVSGGDFLFGVNMKLIPLTGKRSKGKHAMVDDDDYPWLKKRQWSLNEYGYVYTTLYTKKREPLTFLMHRVILKTPARLMSDHEDHNKLNNQKYNLRTCTNMQNQQNSKPRTGGTSKYKGVHWDESIKKWRANIRIVKKRKYLGIFTDEKLAAIAYDNAAIKYFGEFARLNFPKQEK